MNLQDLSLEQLKEIVEGAEYLNEKHCSMYWNPDAAIYEVVPHTTKAIPKIWLKLSAIRTRIKELEPKQKYDWSNVPDVVNWLATDKDGDCAWGFLEEPVIELEDEEWRPVAPYTEIYINGSNGTVAAHKGDWQESLEQRKFKIGDKVTFIRNIEPFQWGAKEKVYEVVDVADNLPTSTDQRVWLDTTASSPHLSRNLCLATAIGQVGIEDLPVHGEPICSEIITNAPVIDEPQTQLDNEAALFNEPNDFDAMSEKHRSPGCKCHELPIDAELKPDPTNRPCKAAKKIKKLKKRIAQLERDCQFSELKAEDLAHKYWDSVRDNACLYSALEEVFAERAAEYEAEIERLKGEQGE